MSTSDFRVESSGIVVRRVRSFRRVTAIVLVACTFTMLVLTLLSGYFPAAIVVELWFAAIFGAIASGGTLLWSHQFHDPTLATARSAGQRGSIEIAGDEIVVEASGVVQRYPTSGIAAGWLEPVEEGHAAVLRMKDGDLLSVRLGDAGSAHALLRAAGVSVDRLALRIRLPSRAEQQAAGRASAVVQLLTLALFGIPCLAALGWVVRQLLLGDGRLAPLLGIVGVAVATASVLLYRIVAFLVSPSVVVGTDGIAIQRGRWRRYIPYRRVASVQKYPLGVRVRTTDGKAILLPTWTKASARAARSSPSAADRSDAKLDEARRDVLYERIQSAMEGGGGDLASAELALLDRGGRTLERWREDLARLLEGATYRDVGLDKGALEQVLSDPAAAPSRRVAAAFALSRADDGAVRDRARIATEACADERLRVAITRAVRGELDDLADELENEPPAPLRRAL